MFLMARISINICPSRKKTKNFAKKSERSEAREGGKEKKKKKNG